jgi:lipid-A-disaccharide synthase-like uncharacterized protein
MKERTSQRLLLVEAVTLLAPITLLTIFYSLALLNMYGSGLFRESAGAHVVAASTFLGLALQLCGWRIVIAFLAKGRRGIASVPRLYFYIVGFGAVLVLVSLLLAILAATDVELPTYAYELMVSYVATPAMIPCCHVLAERAYATRCNVADSMSDRVLAARASVGSQMSVADTTAPRASIDALKAAALVAAGGALMLAASSLLSGIPASATMLAGLVFGAVGTFSFMFFIALLPMPAAILFRKYLPQFPAPAAFALSLVVSLLLVFAALWMIETPPVEVDGDSTIYRHAGPTLNASKNVSYYLYSLPIMFFSLICFHWLRRQGGRSSKAIEPTQ